MNWYSHALKIWKVATLKSLIKGVFMISSTKVTLDKELTHLKEVFTGYNQYPLKLVEEIIKNETRQREVSQNISENY